MGAFSELSLEQQYPEAVGRPVSDEPVQAPQPARQAAAPFASPFIGNGFPSSPFISAAPAQPVKEVITTAQPAALKSSTEPPSSSIANPKEKAPQSVQNFAENAKADKTTDENEDEDAKRKAHEEAEAKRKAEWEAKFAERRAKEQADAEKRFAKEQRENR